MTKISKNDFLRIYEKKSVKVYGDINRKVDVTILVFTYNHGSYIDKCIKSILDQKTEYSYNIFLIEDESTDDTLQICMKHFLQNKDKIVVIANSRENNISVNGRPSGRFSLMYGLFMLCSKYYGVCEGDDYWIDDLKIQKQLDFLESNPQYTICATNSFEKYGPDLKRFYSYLDNELTIEDLCMGNVLITNTVMYRRIMDEYPRFMIDCLVGDYPLALIHAEHGLVYRFRDFMGVYRKNVGRWSSLSEKELLKDRVLMLVDIIKHYSQHNLHVERLLRKQLRLRFTTARVLGLSSDELNDLHTKVENSLGDDLGTADFDYPLYIKYYLKRRINKYLLFKKNT